jgi:hypothetical protein
MCQQDQSPLIAILHNLGIDPCHDNVSIVAKALRRAVVNEWTGDHSYEYTGFLSHTQIEEQGQQFLASGEFSGELGDLVIAALSNILHSPIVLFTSIPNLPVLVLSPSHEVMLNPQPIHLAFTQQGPGHYDIAMHVDQAATSQSEHAVTKCGCGRRTSAGVACTTILEKYSSRCPCYNSRRACRELCNCKNCQNPFGRSITDKEQSTSGRKRKRRAHEVQRFTIRGVKTTAFMEESKLHCDMGSPTAFERLVTLSILQFLTAAGISEYLATHTQTVLAVYNNIRLLATILKVDLPIYQRSANEIGKLILLYASKQIFFSKWI